MILVRALELRTSANDCPLAVIECNTVRTVAGRHFVIQALAPTPLPLSKHSPWLFGTTREPFYVLEEGQGGDLQRFGHCGVDVHHVNEVVDRGLEPQGHSGFMDDFP